MMVQFLLQGRRHADSEGYSSDSSDDDFAVRNTKKGNTKMNSFNEMELHPQILKGVDAAGFEKPFPIQERAIGPLLAGLNVIGQAKRGSLDLSRVKFVVLDEADTMLDMGFIEDVEFILDSVPEPRQMSLFSATMPPRIIDLSEKYIRNPERILIDSDEPSVDELDQYFTIVEQHDKFDMLLSLLGKEDPQSSIVFCRTRYGVRKLT